MRPFYSILLVGVLGPVHAKHRSHIRPVNESKLPFPKGPLVWGDVNFVHTTDIHGWVLGHQHSTWPEPNYSANTGDLYSFLTHLRSQADKAGVDLLLVDSGDHHDGAGIVSVYPNTQEHSQHYRSGGSVVDYHLSKLGYDVLAIGNHELYKYPDALQVADDVRDGIWDKVDRKNGGETSTRFLTSNVEITLDGRNRSESIGARYSKFKTRMGKDVTAFGVLYNFSFNAKNTAIQPLREMVRESWFLEAIQDRPDFFIVAGHMSINRADSEWQLLLDAIREVHKDVPVFIFGGHNHVRNCERLDGNSISFAGGRYMETVGWVSANLTKNESNEMDVSRRYLDSNRRSFKYHARVPDHKFDTHEGKAISESLFKTFDRWNLSSVLGHAPQSYFLSRYPVTDDRSLLKKLMDDVLPATVYDDKVLQHGRKRIYLANSGCQRFDIFKGEFTIDDQYSISPFSSPFVQITLPARIARILRQKMNDEGASQFAPSPALEQGISEEVVRKAFDASMIKQRQDYEDRRQRELEFLRLAYGQTVFDAEVGRESDLVQRYGYVTEDNCGPIGSGDDVEHVPVPYAPVPDYVSTTFPEGVDDEEPVFVIAMTFFLNDVVKAVSKIDPAYPPITFSDFEPCGDSSMTSNQVWGHYARKHWN